MVHPRRQTDPAGSGSRRAAALRRHRAHLRPAQGGAARRQPATCAPGSRGVAGRAQAGQWQAVYKISEVYLGIITIALSTYFLPKLSTLKNTDLILADSIHFHSH